MGRFTPDQLYDFSGLRSHGYAFIFWEQFVRLLPALNTTEVFCNGKVTDGQLVGLGLHCLNNPPKYDLRNITSTWPAVQHTLMYVNAKVPISILLLAATILTCLTITSEMSMRRCHFGTSGCFCDQ